MRDLAAKGITPEFLKECFDCDPVNGNLLWKCRPLSHFKTKAAQVSVNNRFANKTAGFERPDSSMSVKIGCDWYYLHDIIFTIYHGRLPTSKVYHLNGDKRDNRVINLSEYIPQKLSESHIENPAMAKDGFSPLDHLDVKYLKECLHYNPDTGALTWKKRPRSHFKGGAGFENYHRQFFGKSAGSVSRNGYLKVMLNGKQYPAHRICFAIMTGSYPDGMIDHVNGCRADNRFSNLRVTDRVQNMRNMVTYSSNTSGHVGVVQIKDTGKFRAYINSHKNKRKFLGNFDTFEDAVQARKKAEIEYEYHENHGR